MALAQHQHGKSHVRVGRVWRQGNVHSFVEYDVTTMLESDMGHAFLTSSNADMVATDTQKNVVYYIAKQMKEPCSPEEFGVALAQHFVLKHKRVFKAKISVEMQPWVRTSVGGQPHNHGFTSTGGGVRTAHVTFDDKGNTTVEGGVQGLKVLKTTQSGYAGFARDAYTMLKDTHERCVATVIDASWAFSSPPACYDRAFGDAQTAMLEAFFGPPTGGVFSPSVQFTLHEMAMSVLNSVPQINSISLTLPNLHFIPCAPVTSTFEDDVYVATSEPHGNIQAVVTRHGARPHCKL